MSAASSRRQFLVRAARLGAGGAVALWLQPLGCAKSAHTALDLSQVFGEPGDVADVGRRYLERFPEEANASALESQLAEAPLPSDDPAALREQLRESIRADFAQQRWFEYDGWLLSRTEGRLCALAFLDRA